MQIRENDDDKKNQKEVSHSKGNFINALSDSFAELENPNVDANRSLGIYSNAVGVNLRLSRVIELSKLLLMTDLLHRLVNGNLYNENVVNGQLMIFCELECKSKGVK